MMQTPLNSASVLAAYNALRAASHANHIVEMRRRHPKFGLWTDEEINAVYVDDVARFQSKGGKVLEKIVEDCLRQSGIPFKAQVNIDINGMIVESKGVTIPDIVFGNPTVGTHISNYVVMSLKTTSRERSKLDTAWTQNHPPKLFLYGTLEADYPPPEKFQESPTRKLVTAVARKKDTRQYKLGFEDIIREVLQFEECSAQASP